MASPPRRNSEGSSCPLSPQILSNIAITPLDEPIISDGLDPALVYPITPPTINSAPYTTPSHKAT